ncbi:MAG: type II secretion system protein [Phycisphaerales bacterium]|nr:type II secretion system protein [Phycisphaerales bacterium]
MNDLMSRRGFTVVELGVLVALLGSLGAVLVPVGNQLQKNNLDTRSQWVHHDLARRQMMYMGDNKGAFTGPNTTGADWNKDLIGGLPNKGIETLEFDTDGANPTSQGDWISPLVGASYGFSANRAVRTQQRFEVMADPTTNRMVDAIYTVDTPDDYDQFVDVLNSTGFRQRSFLQIRSFTHYSVEHQPSNVVIDIENGIGYFERFAVQHPAAEALSPSGYTPNIVNVGVQLSNKVMIADGTRFYTDGVGLDFDIDTVPQFSTDADSGPIFNGSIAYGRYASSSPSQENLNLSYRKKGGQGMYVTMFDGSLKYMSREESWTDPTPWYPSGSVWQGNGATPESLDWVEKNLVDGVIH